MTKIQLYTFGEVIKILGVSSKDLNKMIDSGKLRPVRHKGRLKFKKADVESLMSSREFYSWDQALTELQMEKEELQRLIDDGEIQIYQKDNQIKFDKQEVDMIIHSKQIDATIVVEQHAPTNRPKDVLSMEVPVEELVQPDYLIESNASSKSESYYNFDQVLTELQIGPSEMELKLSHGEISAFHEQGEMRFRREEIDALKEETPEDEESFTPIVISAGSEAVLNAVDEYLSFDQAVNELQVDYVQLQQMVNQNEIEVVYNNGEMKFKKEVIEATAQKMQKIEPTVILPEEPSEQEDTSSLPQNEPLKLKFQEKNHFTALKNQQRFLVQTLKKYKGG